MALLNKGEYREALKQFEYAAQLDPTNALNNYQKANALVKLEMYETALIELEKLRIQMPRESPIPLLIGNIYKKLGNIDKALHYYTLAQDLEPKDAQRIKGLIESLNQHDELNDDYEYQFK